MNKSEYFALIADWKLKYGVPERGPFSYRPSEVKAACEKCGRIRAHMSRHHKNNLFFFALWRPDLYARRYLEFRREECARLCDSCHKSCEQYYDKLKQELYLDFNMLGEEQYVLLDQSWCENWMKQFTKMFDKWIKKPVRRRKRKMRKSA